MNKSKNYCVLRKFLTVDEAFRYMAGEYVVEEDSVGATVSLLDDTVFPNYVFTNAVSLIGGGMSGLMKEEELLLSLPEDFDGDVTPHLLGFPFLLWSKKLGAFYCFHYDPDLDDVSDEDFCKAYQELVDVYDFPWIIKRAKEVMKNRETEFKIHPLQTLDEIYLEYGVGMRKIKGDDEEN